MSFTIEIESEDPFFGNPKSHPPHCETYPNFDAAVQDASRLIAGYVPSLIYGNIFIQNNGRSTFIAILEIGESPLTIKVTPVGHT